MKDKKFLVSLVVAALSLFMVSSIALAVPSTNVLYQEVDIGGGTWRYDYAVYNTSNNGENINELWINFIPTTISLPLLSISDEWALDPIYHYSTYYDAEAVSGAHIYPVDSALIIPENFISFSYLAYRQQSSIYYAVNFTDSSTLWGDASLVPEPISSILFLSGSAMLTIRGYLRRKKFSK